MRLAYRIAEEGRSRSRGPSTSTPPGRWASRRSGPRSTATAPPTAASAPTRWRARCAPAWRATPAPSTARAPTQYDIRVRLDEIDRNRVDQVANLMVGYSSGPVYLGDVAHVSLTTGPTKIDRKNRQRLVSVQADLQRGYALGNVEAEIRRDSRTYPSGNVAVYFGGESDDRDGILRERRAGAHALRHPHLHPHGRPVRGLPEPAHHHVRPADGDGRRAAGDHDHRQDPHPSSP